MMTTDLGLYIHVPFCKSKCNYCDFCSSAGGTVEEMKRYALRVVEEARTYKREDRLSPSSVFIGGGTPSLLPERILEDLICGVAESFDLSSVAEFTVEANPGAVNKSKLNAYRSLGVNRLSLGFQSVHQTELKKLGRIHTFEEAAATYRLAQTCGFDNVNVDLMFGIPYQTRQSLKQTLDSVLRLSPKHISAYGLIVEEGTPFYREKDSLALPSEDEEYLMYLDICDILGKHGYSHYEISNFAIPGYESKHNLLYWRDKQYIGLGVSAHSYFCGERFSNSSSRAEYLSRPFSEQRQSTAVLADDERFEYAMMRLRLKEGISLSEYFERFGVDFLLGKDAALQGYISGGYVTLKDGRLSLTERGFYISNTILCELL